MRIALIAHETRRNLMVEFCMAYSNELSRHDLIASEDISSIVHGTRCGVNVQTCLTEIFQQLQAKITCGDVDMVIFLRDPHDHKTVAQELNPILFVCDVHNIPIATNIATAERLILGISMGW